MLQCLGLGERSLAGHQALEILAGNVVHYQVLSLARDGKVVGDAGKIGMAQLVQKTGLACELALRVRRDRQVLLEGYWRVELEIDGLVHGAHTALTQ